MDKEVAVILMRGAERLMVTATVPLLLYIGYRLFLMGATGAINISGQKDSVKGSITNLSPGSFCLLLGVFLGAYILFSTVSITGTIKVSESARPTSDDATYQEPAHKEKQENFPYVLNYIGGEGQGELAPSIRIKNVLSDAAFCARMKAQKGLGYIEILNCYEKLNETTKMEIGPAELLKFEKLELEIQKGNSEKLPELKELSDKFLRG